MQDKPTAASQRPDLEYAGWGIDLLAGKPRPRNLHLASLMCCGRLVND